MNNKSSVDILKPLEACSRKEAGTKGSNLKKLTKVDGVTIPKTLCIPSTFFESVKELNNLDSRKNISTFKLPDGFASTVIEQIHEVFGEHNLVIRSSATCEDTPFLSFAGNYSSFLNIQGKKQIIRAIKLCYISMFNENARIYAEKGGIDLTKHSMAILIQPVAQVVKSGVMFTLNPVSLDKDEIVIEFADGLGDGVVGGSVQTKTLIIPISQYAGRNLRFKSLILLGKRIEGVFKHPQDLEWGMLKDGSLVFFQSRPITALKVRAKSSNGVSKKHKYAGKLISRSIGGSVGTAIGSIHCVRKDDLLRNVPENTVLYFEGKVDLKFLQHLSKIRGIIMHGGILSHIAVIARELRIPLVASVPTGLDNLCAEKVFIDGENGLIYKI